MLNKYGIFTSGSQAEDLWTAAAGVYAGAIDTSVTASYTFYLMMLRHPEIQRKAQLEIDSVVGQDRLPVIEDRESLPYINNIIKEIIRFTAVVPVTPHSLDEDDVYMGYRIPKGAWVVANIWAVLHDANVFREPEEFIPERYVSTKERPAEPDLTQAAFGFGRRACPGIHFALASLFIHVTSILCAFDIKPIRNGEGEGKPYPVDFHDGHIRFPRPFKFDITPRSLAKIEMVRQEADR